MFANVLVLLVMVASAHGFKSKRALELHRRPGSGGTGKWERTIRRANSAQTPFVNVLDYGAIGDNHTDCTKAFQAALNYVQTNRKGGIVYAPSGMYVFEGPLQIPDGVTLQGSYDKVPSHDGGRELDDGTVLVPTFGRGDTNPESYFISVAMNAAVTGLVIFHKEQLKLGLPVPYPWAIVLRQNNAAVADVELLNAWNGINATLAGRHYIARVQGQPVNIGIFVDQTYDIGRIEDVHFNPWFSPAPAYMKQQLTHGRAFVFGRSDWEYVFNTFAFGYAIGYHFIQTPTGAMNGNFLGLGADLAINASVRVDAAQPAGLLFTNGEFTAFENKQWLPKTQVNHSSQVVIGPKNQGAVAFIDTSFWGPSSSVARIEGDSITSFSNCQFVEWSEENGQTGLPAIDAKSGAKLIATSNVFHQAKLAISLDPSVSQAIIQGNMFQSTKAEALSLPPDVLKNPEQYAVLGNSFTVKQTRTD